ncbi:hemerythrin domain-containing protein [Chloroflexota bacterium]
MTDHLNVIKSVSDEHQEIKGHVKLVGDTITNHEAADTLQKLRSQWIPGQLDVLATRLDKLKAALSALNTGLNNHFSYEEKSLPSILGDTLMKAVLIEHKQIKEEIANVRKLLDGVDFEGLEREAIIAKEMQVQQVITRILHIIESHANKEETVMEMIRKVLEHEGT